MDGLLSAQALPIPSSFQCPITQEVMTNPVVTVDGQAYEKSAIEQWFRRGHRTSPLTGATLPSLTLTTDAPLQRAIEEYMMQRPEMERQVLSQLSLEEAARSLETDLHEKESLRAGNCCNLDALVTKLREASLSSTEDELRRAVKEISSAFESSCPASFNPGASRVDSSTPPSSIPGRGYLRRGCAQTLPEPSASSCSREAPPSRCIIDFAGHTHYVRCITGCGAEHVASGSLDCTAKVWSTVGSCCVQTLVGHTEGVLCILPIASDDPSVQLATGSSDKTAKLWGWECQSLRQWVCLATFEGHQDAVTALASINSQCIVSGSLDNSVKIWKLATGECQTTLTGGPIINGEKDRNSVQSIATFSSNHIAVGSSSKHVQIWDATVGQHITTLKGHVASIQGVVALGPGIVASCSTDRTIRVWDIGSEKNVATFEGHEDDINSIALLGSGNLISGSSDETVKIWDMKRYGVLTTMREHSDSVFGVAALGQNHALSCSDDKLVKMWGA